MSGKVAVSDLHSRLDYLVAYSSQLVFVASDDLQFQQSTLQSFIAQQPESLEVAFLKGEPDRVDEDYRKEICRQILHKITGQFGDSLRNELKDFEDVDNPILICLSASQHLSKTLLKEMWELVLFARTLRKNLHVNVVLFGDSKWVVQAKAWLPTNKGNKPVLLSADLADFESENTMADGAHADDMSELDSLIANKRAAFAQRIEERASVADRKEHRQSLIQTRKFQIAVGIIFFITFIALVLWFYPQQSEQETQNVSEAEHTIEIPEPVLEEISSDELNETSSIVTETDTESQVESKLEQELVIQWDNQAASTEIATTATEDETETSQTEELIAEPSTETSETQNTAPASTSVHPLAKVEQGQFLIQITATSNLLAAEAFIEDNALQESTWIYTTTRFGGSWYVIVYKKLFKSKDEARSDIPRISTLFKVSSPFVKSIENVQEEIAIAN